MKAGYAALLSLVVAYSAFQGAGSPGSGTSDHSNNTNSHPGTPARLQLSGLLPGADPLPSIDGGICPLKITESGDAPCAPCQAICPASGLRDLIDDYFHAQPSDETKDQAKFREEHWNVPQSAQSNIKFIIAPVPDPVHTHMAMIFDRKIETIQRSAQANGYLFSRAWMPWELSPPSDSPDFSVRLAQAKYWEQRESLPGLMIFQKSATTSGPANSAPAPSILFVFVVGETSTGGLHIEQFQNALKIRQSILRPQASAQTGPTDPAKNAAACKALTESDILRIDGPTFSGSLSSLRQILAAQPHGRFSRILIRSGTISSYAAVRDFLKSTEQLWPCPKADSTCNPSLVGRPDFATFQFSDVYQEFYLGAFFFDRNDPHSRIAVLSEDETAFGNQETRDDTNSASAASSDAPTKVPVPLLRLYFPREIAQLRDAYQQNVKLQSSTSNGNAQPQPGLSLNLTATGNDDDSVTAYAPLQTPLSQESVLQAIVAALRREHAKVVLIRAGDPLDIIFLSRYLRQNYPQARLVTVSTDLLMVHEFYDPRFHGILAVTPYPIVTGIHFPSWPSPTRDSARPVERLFPDSYSVGDFNALQSLLASDSDKQPNGTKLPAASYAQFGLPSFLPEEPGPWRAHLWLTTIGRDGYWPVSVLDDVSPEKLHRIAVETNAGKEPSTPFPTPVPSIRSVSGSPAPASAFSVHLSVGWTIFWLLAFSLTVFTSFLLAFPQAFSHSESLARFAESRSSAHNSLLFTGSILLFLAQTLFLFPAIVWFVRFGQCDAGMSFWQCTSEAFNGMWLILICYLFSTICLGAALYDSFNRRGKPALAAAGIFICAASVLAAPIAAWYWPWQTLPSDWGNFLYRYINIGSGVSPLLPLFFIAAAWIWWCWQSLTGITSTESKQLVLPHAHSFASPPNSSRSSFVPTASERLRLRAVAANDKEWPWKTLGAAPFGLKLLAPAVVILVFILLLMRPSEIAEAFEPKYYRYAYWILLYLSLFLICYLVVHIVGLWLQFRILLQAIERMPFRRGFSDLKTQTWKPLWKLAGAGTQDFLQLLGGEFDALTEIQNNYRSARNLVNAAAAVQNAREKLVATYQKIIAASPFRNRFRSPFRTRALRRFKNMLRQFRTTSPTTRRFRRILRELRNTVLAAFPTHAIHRFKRILRKLRNTVPPASRGSFAALAKAWLKRLFRRKKVKPPIPPARQVRRLFRVLQSKLAAAATEALLYSTLQSRREPSTLAAPDPKDPANNRVPDQSPSTDPALRAVEYFLCLFYLNIILVPLRRLQTLILALAGVFVFVMISYSSYPFESRESFHALLISIFFAISLVVGVVYGQMYANPLLSRITNTTPGELGLDFWVRLGTFVFIPLLSLISAQFPAVNSFLFSWLEPALQSIK
jgi:hypothetical protein